MSLPKYGKFPNLEELLWKHDIDIPHFGEIIGRSKDSAKTKLSGKYDFTLDEMTKTVRFFKEKRGVDYATMDYIFKVSE